MLSPISSAVFLIDIQSMQEDRHVLVILTGDNACMRSTPPTFAGIPESEIIGYRNEMVAEVSLKTAVRYLRYLDSEEERVNDVLRRTTERRRQALVRRDEEDARSRALLCCRRSNHTEVEDKCVLRAARKVFERAGDAL